MSNYPTSLDDGTTIPNPSGTNTQDNPDHAALHTVTGDAVKAVEAKLGTGATTPTANTLLRGTGTGTSAWGSLTSAQLAASVSDETGSGSVVFANTPTLITPKVDTINEATPTNGVTIDGLSLKVAKLNTNDSVVTTNITDANVTTAKLADDSVTAAKMQYGMVRHRQGGTTGDASWLTGGTSNTDTSAKAVWIQVGSTGIVSSTLAITFPVAFNQAPVVILTTNSANSVNAWAEARSVTTTGFTIGAAQASGTSATTESFSWIAIGQ